MFTSLSAIQAALRQSELNCVALVNHYLEQTRKYAHLNAFLEVFEEEALQKAHLIDEKISKGTAGKLAGLVIGIKDLLCYQNHRLAASSKILEGFIAQFNATAVQKLLEEDAIILGRQNCDEFGMGSSNENSAYGIVKNALGEEFVPGGSSGGSAVAVQAGMCLASLGTDTGGSVRQPASFCGLVGLKPTYGRISRYGLAAYASSLDTIGILANNVEDTALILEVIAGQDAFDSTVSHLPVPLYSQFENIEQKRHIAYIRETVEAEGIAPEVKANTLKILEKLREEGNVVNAISFPLIKYVLPAYYIISTAEASSNLARYDGIRYGKRAEEIKDLESLYTESRTKGFGKEVKRRILLGTFVLSSDYYDAYYTKAQKVRRLIKEATDEILSRNDFLLLPTTPSTAFRIGAHRDNALQMYLEDLFTVQANLTGLPAISIPNGCDEKSLPIGLQIIGKTFDEANLLSFSRQLLGNK